MVAAQEVVLLLELKPLSKLHWALKRSVNPPVK